MNEDTMSMAGPRKSDPVLTLRRVFVHSSARAQPRSPPAPGNWTGPARTSNGWNAASVASLPDRPRSAPESRRSPATGGSAPTSRRDRNRPRHRQTHPHLELRPRRDRRRSRHRRLVRPADQPDPGEADAAGVLILYKGQEAVERRYSAFKGPLAVAALFLNNNRRIAALITVICLALLIFCLIERQVRQALAGQGKTKVDGLYAGRPAIPTGRLILGALATMKIIPGTATTRQSSPSPRPSSSGSSTCSASTHGNSADDHPRAEYGARPRGSRSLRSGDVSSSST